MLRDGSFLALAILESLMAILEGFILPFVSFVGKERGYRLYLKKKKKVCMCVKKGEKTANVAKC